MISEKREAASAHGAPKDLTLLSEAFLTFHRASGELTQYYNKLERRVESLTAELEKKNRDLEANLQEGEKTRSYLENILENLTTGVIVLDLSGHISLINSAARTMTGHREAEGLTQDLPSLLALHDDEFDKSRSLLSLVDALDGTTLRRRVGRDDRFIHVSAGFQYDAMGQVVGTIVLLKDVTRIKALEQEDARKTRLASMGEMAANMAHEIRNPLGGIELFASILRKELEGDRERQDLADNVMVGVKSLNHIVSNLLYYTRPLKPVIKAVSVRGIVEESLLFAGHALRPQGIDLFVTYEGPEKEIGTDGELVKQVIMNLILNAVQAMPHGGTLNFETVTQDRGVEFRVTDTGTGIDEESLGKIFNPFYTTRSKGTGLGLGIAHHILETLGGTIGVSSRLGEGTTFTVGLPCRAEASKKAGMELDSATRT
ncbi:MAG: ATP-binding protein [bacterium]|nr:ATP-binding protein [bacterium]